MHENFDLDLLLELANSKQYRRLKELLSDMNEVDIAEFMDELEPEQLIVVFRLLPKNWPPTYSPIWRTVRTRKS